MRLLKVDESPIDEDFPGLKDYEEREKLIKHRKDSIDAVLRMREELSRDTLATLQAEEKTDTMPEAGNESVEQYYD